MQSITFKTSFISVALPFNKHPASSTFLPAQATTLKPIAEAEEPNKDDIKIDEAVPIGQSAVHKQPGASINDPTIPSKSAHPDKSTLISKASVPS
ncbi:hypothetical protein C0989_009037 [Termitomyces sp. Mn162]|nr:hypothetical protein C0989_009037 [Termitomyces sp. Mn162]